MTKLPKLLMLTPLLFSMGLQAQTLDEARIDTVKQYLSALQSANVSQMLGLFAPGGTVVSTSKGRVNVEDFFPNFFPEIQSASVQTGTIYKSEDGKYSASFSFSWHLKEGESGGGHYVDEFFFVESSNKLQTVYMYENIKFN